MGPAGDQTPVIHQHCSVTDALTVLSAALQEHGARQYCSLSSQQAQQDATQCNMGPISANSGLKSSFRETLGILGHKPEI